MPFLNEVNPGTDAGLRRRSQEPFPRTLLVVDDERGTRESVNMIFRGIYRVLQASSGPEALELLERYDVQTAILDIRMAGMTGIELLERIKGRSPNVEVIMLTAYETVETACQALRLGACDYLLKPFDLKQIREAVSKAMQRHELAADFQSTRHLIQGLRQELNQRKLREESARAQGELYASVIHDINGPLTIIAGFVDLIGLRMNQVSKLEGRELLELKSQLDRISLQVQNSVRISRRYLSFLRSKSNQSVHLNIRQVLKDLEELLEAHPSRKDHRFEVTQTPPDAVPDIHGTDLIQILLNLVINAFQCSVEPHSVAVDVEAHASLSEEPSEEFKGAGVFAFNLEGLRGESQVLAVQVEDDGPGIAKETLPRIFEPYFSTKSKAQGTGLGLAIVCRLAKMAGSGLKVESKPGAGTRITLFIRIKETP